jgi:hypothetical protein
LTRALAATVLGAGIIAPAAAVISQGAAHAVVDENGEDGILNLGANNAPQTSTIINGDNIQPFGDFEFRSAHDVDLGDGAILRLCDIADVFC